MERNTEGTEETEDTKGSEYELTRRIIGGAIEVHRMLGPGLLESVYEAALCQELRLRGLRVERQVDVPVTYKGIRLHPRMRIDLIVGNQVVVEVKSVDLLHRIHQAQLLTYLKLTNLRLGLLFNFNVELLRSGMRRIVNG
jgi:GxxExxY protein